MKRIGFVLLFTLFAVHAYATEPISRDDFIEITNKTLDALDEVEAASDGSRQQKYALQKLDAALKRYDRYGEITPGKQQDIVQNIRVAIYGYTGANVGVGDQLRWEARVAAKKARELFADYIKLKK